MFSTYTILFLPTLSSLGNRYRSRESHYKTLRLAFRTQHKWPVFCDLRSSFSLFPTLSFIPFLNFPSFYIIKKNELSYILLRRNVHNNNNVRTLVSLKWVLATWVNTLFLMVVYMLPLPLLSSIKWYMLPVVDLHFISIGFTEFENAIIKYWTHDL